MKKLVIIPTYNEKENIELLIPEIKKLGIDDLDILVVDDSSPDGTGDLVLDLAQEYEGVNLLSRSNKAGLAKAYLAGFAWAIERDYEWFIEMDADFSHRPIDLKKLVDNMSESDFLVGSRYTAGGGVANWPLIRKLISKGGSTYAKMILQEPLNDWTGGFNAWKTKIFKESVHLDQIKSEGYSFQIELKFKALKAGFSGKEVPILFEDRKLGESKMSFKIVLEAFYRVWQIRFS